MLPEMNLVEVWDQLCESYYGSERGLDQPIGIGLMNYEILSQSKPSHLSASLMTPGQMGFVVGGTYDGHLVWMSDAKTLYSLTDSKSSWSDVRKGGTGENLKVRLLRPGEEVLICGK